jgi:hypothetical protein
MRRIWTIPIRFEGIIAISKDKGKILFSFLLNIEIEEGRRNRYYLYRELFLMAS